jgi:hypothetical protein
MTEDTTYNGWKNYATWGVALVLDSDAGTYNYVREKVAEIKADAPDHRNVPDLWTAEEAARFEVADFLKDYTEELCGFGGVHRLNTMAHQVIGAGLADVDWDEIASNILSE